VPLQNRVTPLGDLVATPERGLVYGNRGCLHDAAGAIRRRYATRRWIACRLEFRGWHRTPLMQPGRFTELFFLDEATAFAAGHRPCALCRRGDYDRLVAVWRELHPGDEGADAIDARLHAERLAGDDRRGAERSVDGGASVRLGRFGRRLHVLACELPDGAFVVREGKPWLVRGGDLRRWTPGGYGEREPVRGDEALLTPPSLVELLSRGWQGLVPLLHPSANVNCAE
jgi:hypothetical protein